MIYNVIKLLSFCLLLASCSTIKPVGQAYIDINQNIDYEHTDYIERRGGQNEVLAPGWRSRTRFKVGYKINLFEKHNLYKKKQ